MGPNCSHLNDPCVFIICVAAATPAARSVSSLLTCYKSWPEKCRQKHNKIYASSFNLSKYMENFVRKNILLDLTAQSCQVSLIIADSLRGVGTSQRKYSPKYFTMESVSQPKDRSCWLPPLVSLLRDLWLGKVISICLHTLTSNRHLQKKLTLHYIAFWS